METNNRRSSLESRKTLKRKTDLCYSKTIFISSLFVHHCGSGRLSVHSIYPIQAPDRRLYLLWMFSSDMKRIYRCCYDKFYYQDQRHNGGIEKIRPCVVLWEVETWIMQQRRSMKNLERESDTAREREREREWERERELPYTHAWVGKQTHTQTHTHNSFPNPIRLCLSVWSMVLHGCKTNTNKSTPLEIT